MIYEAEGCQNYSIQPLKKCSGGKDHARSQPLGCLPPPIGGPTNLLDKELQPCLSNFVPLSSQTIFAPSFACPYHPWTLRQMRFLGTALGQPCFGSSILLGIKQSDLHWLEVKKKWGFRWYTYCKRD